jgi:hypothetical protein
LRPWNGTAGHLAQAVQRSAFPDRYDQREGEARGYLARGGLLKRFAGGGFLGNTNPLFGGNPFQRLVPSTGGQHKSSPFNSNLTRMLSSVADDKITGYNEAVAVHGQACDVARESPGHPW